MFRYWNGVNPAALITFIIVAVLIYAPLPYHWALFDGSWLLSFTVSGLIYLPLMKYWVIPRYQPQLTGGLLRGYVSAYTRTVFGVA